MDEYGTEYHHFEVHGYDLSLIHIFGFVRVADIFYGFINGCFDSMDFCVCHTLFVNSFTSVSYTHLIRVGNKSRIIKNVIAVDVKAVSGGCLLS